MRLVTFAAHADASGRQRIGALTPDERIVDLPAAHAAAGRDDGRMPDEMVAFFAGGHTTRDLAEHALAFVQESLGRGDTPRGPEGEPVVYDRAGIRLLAPVPRPNSIRDYLTYSAHAGGSGLALPEAFHEMPICYKGNVASVVGPEEELLWPAYTNQLDYELELGFYIGKQGRNIPVEAAAEYIAAITIFNDVSARDIQLREMELRIGPSKGKDFCNVMGPCAVTPDELDEYNIVLRARVNGKVWSEGTSRERAYSFAQVVAWASYCETIYPGDFMAVGTVGGGCGFELNRWIQPGDIVELEAVGIGVLRNRVGQREQVPAGAGLASYKIPVPVGSTPH